MGTIPTYRAKEIPLVTEPAPPPFSPRALSGIRSLARNLETRQMQEDLVRAREAEMAFADWQTGYLGHPQSGLLARQGAAVRDSRSGFLAAAEARYVELADGLDNDSQRLLFHQRSRQRLGRGLQQLAAHEAAETDLHRRVTMAAAALEETGQALDLGEQGDAEAADAALATAVGFLGQSLEGAGGADQERARELLISGYHSTRFSRLLAGDPEQARRYLADHQAAIDADVVPQLEQQAQRTLDRRQGQALFEATYAAEASAADLDARIDAAPATDRVREIARQLTREQRQLQQAEQVARTRRQAAAREQTVRAALAWLEAGGRLDDLPPPLADGLSDAARTTLLRVQTRELTGTAAPYDAALETELHGAWIRALAGEDPAFTDRPLTPHLGHHNRDRMAVWMQRQEALRSADPEIRRQHSRRRPSYQWASEFVTRRTDRGRRDADSTTALRARLNAAAIAWIDQWHDAHPDQSLAPAHLLQSLEALAVLMTEVPPD